MTSLVLELQRDAFGDKVSIESLLRKAKVAAVKLNAHDITNWIDLELKGYNGDETIPNYRIVHGTLKARNYYNGRWVPVHFQTPEAAEGFSKRGIGSSVAELEQIMSGGAAHDAQLQLSLPPKFRHALMEANGVDFEPAFIFSPSAVRGILSRVRQTVLDWALELEARGVSGEGLSFTNEEKSAASTIHFNISASRNVTIVGGDSVNSTITVGDHTLDLNAVKAMIAQIDAASFEGVDGKLIQSTKDEIEQELAKPAPNLTRVRAYLGSIKAIAEGAVGNVAAHGLVQMISKLLG